MRTRKDVAQPCESGDSRCVATEPVGSGAFPTDLSTGARPKHLNLHTEWLVAGVILASMVGAQWLFVSCDGGV